METCILVVGIGNGDRGDDASGLVAARHLRHRNLPEILVGEQSGAGIDLITLWQSTDVRMLYVIDAMCSGLPPGTIQRFEAHSAPLPAQFSEEYSTHSFGLAQGIELARVLGCLPPQVIVYGIEGRCFDPGAPLSAEVEAATLKTAELIMTELFPLPDNPITEVVTV